MSVWKLYLSGTFQLNYQSEQIIGFRTKKARILLAYLAMNPDRPHLRSELCALFWPELSDASGKANLRNILSNLRHLFSPDPRPLGIGRHEVTVHSEFLWVDMQALVSGPSYETVTLYSGDFIPGFALDQTPELESWRLLTQERLHLFAMGQLDRLTDEAMQAGKLDRVIELAQKQLTIERFHERAHFQLIKALIVQGLREPAIMQFERCKEILADALGIEPSAELQQLVDRLRQGEGVVDVKTAMPVAGTVDLVVRHNLPRPTSRFIGRQSEVEQLERAILDSDYNGNAAVVTLLGLGGMGKSRLAIEIAYRWLSSAQKIAAQRYPDGLYFVPLAPIDEVEKIPLAIAEAVGYFFYEGESDQQQIFDYLAERSAFIILDNFEHLLSSPRGESSRQFLLALIDASPNCQFLVTSREKLNLGGEVVIQLNGLTTSDRYTTGGNGQLAAGEAELLFASVARRNNRDFDLQANLRVVHNICQLLEGLPLAIMLAASLSDSIGVNELAREMMLDVDLLSTDRVDLPDRQRSLRATFGYSWRLLSDQEQDVLRTLSVFRGGFTRHAARAVAGVTILQLARLVGKSFLAFDAQINRYSVHELLRQLCAEQLDGSQSARQAVCHLHSQHYLDELILREKLFTTEKQQEIISSAARDFANIRAGWRWVIEQQNVARLHEGLESLFFFFFFSGRERDGVSEFERTLKQLEGFDDTPEVRFLEARIHNRISELTHLYMLPNPDGLDEREALFRERSADLEIGLLLARRAELALLAGDIARAIGIYREQLELFDRIGDKHRYVNANTQMAQLFILSDRPDVGLQLAQHSLDVSQKAGDLLSSSVAILSIAYYQELWPGDFASAAESFRQVERIGQQVRDVWQVTTGYVISKVHLGFLAMLQGDIAAAEDALQLAYELSREKNTNFVNAVVLGLDSLIDVWHGRYEQARHKADRGISLSSRPGSIEMCRLARALASVVENDFNLALTEIEAIWIQAFLWQKQPGRMQVTLYLPAVAKLLVVQGQKEMAVTALSAGINRANGPKVWFEGLPFVRELFQSLRQDLSAEVFEAAWNRGMDSNIGELQTLLFNAVREHTK